MRRQIVAGLVALIAIAAATVAYAGSALHLYDPGRSYVKHVNWNSPATDSATTILSIENRILGSENIRIRFSARAQDGSTVAQSLTIRLNSGEKRTVVLRWSKRITDLNFLDLIELDRRPDPT